MSAADVDQEHKPAFPSYPLELMDTYDDQARIENPRDTTHSLECSERLATSWDDPEM